MAIQTQTRQIGDTRTAIAATMTRPDGTVVDLSGLSVEFRMCTAKGVDKVAQTALNVTVTDAAAGEVQYSPQAADVDTVGVFHAYFIITTTGDDTFPVEQGAFQIKFMDC